MRALLSGLLLALTALTSPALAASTNVAVAANFTKPAEDIAAAFAEKTGDTIVLSFGATGALYAQVTQGAPFTVFLSADNKRPTTAVAEGFGVEGTVFTYAVGKVVLYAPTLDLTDGETVLKTGDFQHIAIAEPTAAPYGFAAMETIEKLGLTDALADKLVTGENITQTQQFIDSANAELGFVALSQVIDRPAENIWQVPADYYTPIYQDAVLLKTGEADEVAKAFIDFLKGEQAHAIIESYGYAIAE